VPTLAVPVQPLLLSSEDEYGMFSDFKKYPWVLEVTRYRDVKHLLTSFEKEVVLPAEAKVLELRSRDGATASNSHVLARIAERTP